jgi:HEAT repeat protein
MDIKELQEKVLNKNWDALDIIDTSAQPQEAIESLVEWSKSEDAEVREISLNCLAMIADPAVPAILAGALGDEDGDIRLFALQALQTSYDESVVNELVVNLNNDDTEIRSGAALLLGNIGQDAATEPLEKRLAGEQDEMVQRDLKLALAKLGNSELKTFFADQMDVPNSETRLQGLSDLRYIGDKNLAVKILSALDDTGNAHLISDKNQPVPEYARVCDAAVNLVAELYGDNPFQFDVDEFKVYSDDEIGQVKSFLSSLKSE